ncbi:cyclopropane-fatty-acyl-phospholipid synthase family protein [soil metagenome]
MSLLDTSSPSIDPPARSRSGRFARLGAAPLRRALRALLARVRCGSITIQLPDRSRLDARGDEPGPHAFIEVHRWRALARLFWQGDIGLAESYREGDWSTCDLTAVLEFGACNDAAMDDKLTGSLFARLVQRAVHRLRDNSRRRARQNITAHYDLGNTFYSLWLDPRMIYSSALYRHESQTLEQAQRVKIDRVVETLGLQAGQSVLEIGCGWGALALAMAERHDAKVTGLTLSPAQLAHARAQVQAAGRSGSVDLRLQDYRDVEGRFDRIVSIEMLEAVGESYWPTYFDTVRDRLAPGGRAAIQVITIADGSFDSYRRGVDFIQRFIFPGGMLPSKSVMKAQVARVGLELESVESFGISYARTLVEWRRRFEDAWPAIAALGFDEAFRRLWRYYLCYCEAGFRTGRVDVSLYTLRSGTA